MKGIFFLSLFLGFLLPTKIISSRPSRVSAVCHNFVTGEIDAHKTMEALGLDIDDYSIGINNTAKIFCA